MTEAYLTKMLWTMVFLLLHGILLIIAFGDSIFNLFEVSVWSHILLTAFVSGAVGLPLMILLDRSVIFWMSLFSTQQTQLTGADFYQAQSQQRKYLK